MGKNSQADAGDKASLAACMYPQAGSEAKEVDAQNPLRASYPSASRTGSSSRGIDLHSTEAPATWPSSFTSSAIFISLYTRPATPIWAATALRWNLTLAHGISTRPGYRRRLQARGQRGFRELCRHRTQPRRDVRKTRKTPIRGNLARPTTSRGNRISLPVQGFTKRSISPLSRANHTSIVARHAPEQTLDLDSIYMTKAATPAGQQLAKAGFRLASLLNGIGQSSSGPPHLCSCHVLFADTANLIGQNGGTT